jgi:hypothetical protein
VKKMNYDLNDPEYCGVCNKPIGTRFKGGGNQMLENKGR